MNLWRIASETRRYPADDLSGAGARVRPGRWNDHRLPAVYAAPTISMAVLETAAHLEEDGLPLNRFLVRLDVPEGVWQAREVIDPAGLAPAWTAIPAGRASVKQGAAWLASQSAPILLVPSVIVPEEPVAVVNPLHPMAREITAAVVRPFEYDRLFHLRR
jgi:RES domain-containing protein